MPLKVLRESRIEHCTEFSLNFDTDRNGGYSFPCDHTGKVVPLAEPAQDNYARCISGEVQTIRPAYIRERNYTKHTYAVGECYCGAEIELDPDSEGLCYCYCGKCYNSAGQSIRSRSEWEESCDDY